MNFMVKPIHFCEIPKRGAVCGYPLLVEDWSRYYNETTNCFANITCEKCREWVHHNKISPTGWKLWLDDQLADPDAPERHTRSGFIGAASTAEAIALVESLGVPEYMSLDHDLGQSDRSMDFLKWLSNNYTDSPPKYDVHSANPIGRENIISFMESWNRSIKT
jgi:hypothetical protein